MKKNLLLLSGVLAIGSFTLVSKYINSSATSVSAANVDNINLLFAEEVIYANANETVAIPFESTGQFDEFKLVYYLNGTQPLMYYEEWSSIEGGEGNFEFNISYHESAAVLFEIIGLVNDVEIGRSNQFGVIWGTPTFEVTFDNGDFDTPCTVSMYAGINLSQIIDSYSGRIESRDYYLAGFDYYPQAYYDETTNFYNVFANATGENDTLDHRLFGNITLYGYWYEIPDSVLTFTDMNTYQFNPDNRVRYQGGIELNSALRSIALLNSGWKVEVDVEVSPFEVIGVETPSYDVTLYSSCFYCVDASFGEISTHVKQDEDTRHEFYNYYGNSADYVYLDCYGYEEDYADFTELIKNKIVIVNRGELTFDEKVNNAVNAGASGIFVINSEKGGDTPVNNQYPMIPFGLIDNQIGSYIKNNIAAEQKGDITYYQGKVDFGVEEEKYSEPFEPIFIGFDSLMTDGDIFIDFYAGIENGEEMIGDYIYESSVNYYVTIYDADGLPLDMDHELLHSIPLKVNEYGNFEIDVFSSPDAEEPDLFQPEYGSYPVEYLEYFIEPIDGYVYKGLSFTPNGEVVSSDHIWVCQNLTMYAVYEEMKFVQSPWIFVRDDQVGPDFCYVNFRTNFDNYGLVIKENDEVIYSSNERVFDRICYEGTLTSGFHNWTFEFKVDIDNPDKIYSEEVSILVPEVAPKIHVGFIVESGRVLSFYTNESFYLPDYSGEVPEGYEFYGWEYNDEIYIVGYVFSYVLSQGEDLIFVAVFKASETYSDEEYSDESYIEESSSGEEITSSEPISVTSEGPIDPGDKGGSGRDVNIGLIIGLSIGAALLLALIIFIIIWFGIKKKSFEDLKDVFRKKNK